MNNNDHDIGTQVSAPGRPSYGRIADVLSTEGEGLYLVQWPNGQLDTIAGDCFAPRTLTVLCDRGEYLPAGSGEWVQLEPQTTELPIAAPGHCEHTFTVCAECAENWAYHNDDAYIFLSPWPSEWSLDP
ncbi:hypothetical protein [Nocardia cyriacigeorgica]|uniref:hypothetical protein n=1 Tax=Nocardia cyriacigeorgica TaxID=135487 RepID=UPI0035152902